MWFGHRKAAFRLSAPVRGHHEVLSSSSNLLLAIHPTDLAVYAPLNGEVKALTSNSARIIGIDEQVYRLALSTQSGHFDWQVRVGDTVSPISLLGTLSQDLSASAVVTCERLSETATAQPTEYAFNY